jgi:hypothetical protein
MSPLGVKTGKAQNVQMFSGVPPKADPRPATNCFVCLGWRTEGRRGNRIHGGVAQFLAPCKSDSITTHL